MKRASSPQRLRVSRRPARAEGRTHRSLSDHGLAATQVQVIGNAVQIQMKNVSFPAWTSWVDDARKQFKVQVAEAHVSAQGRRPGGSDGVVAAVYREMTAPLQDFA
jgi:Type II secretory pathway, component PulM